jgi:hypothetical protein
MMITKTTMMTKMMTTRENINSPPWKMGVNNQGHSKLLLLAMVVPTTTAIVVLARYQKREKGREKERGEK